MADLLAAAATRTVEVPEGIDTIGFARRPLPSGVHEPPEVTALMVSDGERQALVVACDAIAFQPRQAAETRARIASSTGLREAQIMLACSHSHALPTVDPDWKIGGFQEEWTAANATYQESFHQAIEAAAEQAGSSLVPARLGIGRGASSIVVNRRLRLPDGQMILGVNPDGYADDTVTVIRVDALEGGPVATLVNFGCHPTTVGPGDSTVVSPDYPAAMRKIVSAASGAPVLFLQGAAGDTGTIEGMVDWQTADHLGRILGYEAARVWEEIETRSIERRFELVHSFNTTQKMVKEVLPDPPARVTASDEMVALPLHEIPELEYVESELGRFEGEIASGEQDGLDEGALNVLRMQRRWARRTIKAIEAGRADHIVTDVQVITINQIQLVGLPVEPFARTAEVLRDRIGPDAVCVGLANGSVGYMPLPEDYEDGGYEVTGAQRSWAFPAPLAPAASELVFSTVEKLIKEEVTA